MALELEGGCLVAGIREGEPVRSGNLQIWSRFRGDAISMRVLKIDGKATIRNDDGDEVLYVLERGEGIHLPSGSETKLDGSLTVVSVSAHNARYTGVAKSVRLADQPIQHTADRWYRELIQSEITQFVGSIPPGRAPDHFHLYEEIICVLKGSGFVWSGKSKAPIAAGTCIYLPKRQPHCVENTSSGELRLLGVFYPAGSPAVRYEVHQRADHSPAER